MYDGLSRQHAVPVAGWSMFDIYLFDNVTMTKMFDCGMSGKMNGKANG